MCLAYQKLWTTLDFDYFQFIFTMLDVVNILRGFFIFLVLICKPSILEKTKNRHPAVSRLLAFFLTCFCCPKTNNTSHENCELLPMHERVTQIWVKWVKFEWKWSSQKLVLHSSLICTYILKCKQIKTYCFSYWNESKLTRPDLTWPGHYSILI